MAEDKGSKKFTEESKETLQKIINYLNSTLWLGIPTGLIGIIGYSLTTDGWKLLFFSILLAAAAYVSGFFLGFLFGIPKRINDEKSGYLLNTNLVDISDWLTKIIIGLGLVELKKIPSYLQSAGDYIQLAINIRGEKSIHVFAISCIVYFSIFGLYYGYSYMRLFLSIQFKFADDMLIKEEVTKKGEKLADELFIPNKIDVSVNKKLTEYTQQLRKVKTEAEYTFDDWYLKGITAYNKNEYEKTVVFMNNALQKDMNHKKIPDAYLYLGLAYSDLGQNEKATEQYDKIISNYPTYSLMDLVHYDKGIALDDSSRYNDALKEYDLAIKIDGKYSDFWFNRASVLYNLERYEEALYSYNKAIELGTEGSDAWSEKGDILNILERYQEALEAFNKAISINSKNTDAWIGKVEALVNLEQFKEVLIACEEALKMEANDETLWFDKGFALISIKNFQDALIAFNRYLELVPDDAEAWYNKACCFAKLNDKNQMLTSLKKAIELENEFKQDAKKDDEFISYREDEQFKKLVE